MKINCLRCQYTSGGQLRMEYCEYHVLSATKLTGDSDKWPKLTTIGVNIHYRQERGGKASLKYHYYINSAELDCQTFANVVRSHWGIENNLPCVLDTTMNEDACQLYLGNATENLAHCRHISLHMLKADKTKKNSIPRKQMFTAMQTN
jgi:predicted transposase YbfD/YdcC